MASTPVITPPPFRSQVVNSQGLFEQAWSTWHTEVFTALSAPGLFVLLGDPSGTIDSSTALNALIRQIHATGHGGTIYVPGGFYKISAPITFPTNCVPITIWGDGEGTQFQRGANMPTGKGMFDVTCDNLTLRSFSIDGRVLTATGVNYSDIAGNPMISGLTGNTSIWVHSLVQRFSMDWISIRHTGGYSVLIDPVLGLIREVRILNCTFENNRPHLFGTSDPDLTYGSWTGGIYVNGDGRNPGSSQVLRGFRVEGCLFRRNTGNCLWSHLYGLLELHSDVRYLGNSFEDCGLDGILVGGISGGAVESNIFHRIGLVCTNDTSPGVPKWLANANAVALDSAGIVKGVIYKGNSFTSINGGCMDLDGHADGAITGNVCRIPYVTEPEYAEDQIASFGPVGFGIATYGAQVSNSNNEQHAAVDIEISGNQFINIPNGSVKLFAARDCQVIGNNIIVPNTPIYPPISMGNIGTGPYQRAYNNKVNHNRLTYSPAAPGTPAVIEDSGGGARPFSPGDKNYVYGNCPIIGNGNAVEFIKDAATSSPHYAETVWFP